MTNDPMLHERCDDHPEVCRLDRLQGCMYTRGEEEQCAEQTVSSLRPSVVPRSVPRSVQISLQRIPAGGHCPHLLTGFNTPNHAIKYHTIPSCNPHNTMKCQAIPSSPTAMNLQKQPGKRHYQKYGKASNQYAMRRFLII